MDTRDGLAARAGTVSAIFRTVAGVVIILGLLAIVAGFIQTIAANEDELFVGIMAGVLVAFVIAVYVVVAWAGVQMFALVSGYIGLRSGGEIE